MICRVAGRVRKVSQTVSKQHYPVPISWVTMFKHVYIMYLQTTHVIKSKPINTLRHLNVGVVTLIDTEVKLQY